MPMILPSRAPLFRDPQARGREDGGSVESALKLNPRYAAAHALLAVCYQMMFIQGGHREQDKIEGLKHARAAITGAGDDATALATAAMVMGHLGGDHSAAIDTIKSALAINPSSATVNYHACHIYYLSGDFAQGRLHADRALRLSPRDPLAFQAYYAYGFTALHEGRPGEAASWFGRAAQANGAPRTLSSLRPRPWPWTAARAQAARSSSSIGGSTEPICRNVRSNRNDARTRRQTRRRRAPAGSAGIKLPKIKKCGGPPAHEIIVWPLGNSPSTCHT